jgi:hypothetical protein
MSQHDRKATGKHENSRFPVLLLTAESYFQVSDESKTVFIPMWRQGRYKQGAGPR